MLRLNKSLEHKLVTDIEILRTAFPGSAAPSVLGKEELKSRGSVSGSTSYGSVILGEGTAHERLLLPGRRVRRCRPRHLVLQRHRR